MVLAEILSLFGPALSPPTLLQQPPPPPKKKTIPGFWILCQNLLTGELKIRAIRLVLQKIFIDNHFLRKYRLSKILYSVLMVSMMVLVWAFISFGSLFTASPSPRQRPYDEGILLSYGRILPRLRCSCSKFSWFISKFHDFSLTWKKSFSRPFPWSRQPCFKNVNRWWTRGEVLWKYCHMMD